MSCAERNFACSSIESLENGPALKVAAWWCWPNPLIDSKTASKIGDQNQSFHTESLTPNASAKLRC